MPNDIAFRWHAGSATTGSPAQTSAGTDASCHQFHMSLPQNPKPPDNVFHGSAVLQGFPPAWPWNGQINSSFETNWNYTPRCLNVRMCERWRPRSDCWWNVKMWKIQWKGGRGREAIRDPSPRTVKLLCSAWTGMEPLFEQKEDWKRFILSISGEILQPCDTSPNDLLNKWAVMLFCWRTE